MSKEIEFIAQDDYVWNVRPRPYPAMKNMPSWWKDMPVYADKDIKIPAHLKSPGQTVTVKRCVPTIDALGAGYYVPLSADILVEQENNYPTLTWSQNVPLVDKWNPIQVSTYGFEEGYSKAVFKNLHGWTIKTPPGWSCMIVHPIAYPNLPFQTIPGIVDTDVYDGEINVPFVIREGFEGIIERDTPMFQVIPFKREHWDSKFSVKAPKQHSYDLEKFYSKISRAYYSIIKDKKIYR